MGNIDWKDIEEEFPPCDGNYRVCNSLESFNEKDCFEIISGVAMYDGYGFILKNIYRDIKYWAYLEKREKRYGKLTNDSNQDDG